MNRRVNAQDWDAELRALPGDLRPLLVPPRTRKPRPARKADEGRRQLYWGSAKRTFTPAHLEFNVCEYSKVLKQTTRWRDEAPRVQLQRAGQARLRGSGHTTTPGGVVA